MRRDVVRTCKRVYTTAGVSSPIPPGRYFFACVHIVTDLTIARKKNAARFLAERWSVCVWEDLTGRHSNDSVLSSSSSEEEEKNKKRPYATFSRACAFVRSLLLFRDAGKITTIPYAISDATKALCRNRRMATTFESAIRRGRFDGRPEKQITNGRPSPPSCEFKGLFKRTTLYTRVCGIYATTIFRLKRKPTF